MSNVRNRANEKYLRDSNLQYEKEYMKAMNKYQNDRMEIRHDLTLLQNDLRQLATNKSKYYYSPYQSKGSLEAGVEKNDHVPKSHRKRSCSSPKKRDGTLPNVDISKGTPQVGVNPSKKANSQRGSNASSISGSSKLEGLLDGSIRLPKINCKEMDMKPQDKPITAKVPHAKTDLEILKPKQVDLVCKEVPKKPEKLTGLPIIQHRTHTPKRHVHFDESNLRATKSSPPSHFRKSSKIVGTKICVEDQELPPVLEKFMVRLNPEDSGNIVEHKHNPIRKWKMAVNTMSAMNHMYHMSKVVLAVKSKVRENELRSHMGEDVKLRIQRPHLTSYLLSRQDGHGAASLVSGN